MRRNIFRIFMVCFATMAFGKPESVMIDTATHLVFNPIVHFGPGTTLDGTGATLIGFGGGGIGGSVADSQVAFGIGTNIGGSDNFQWDYDDNVLIINGKFTVSL